MEQPHEDAELLGWTDHHVHLEASARLARAGARQPSNTADRGGRGNAFEAVLRECLIDLAKGQAAAADLRFNPLAWERRRGISIELQLDVISRLRHWAAIELGLHWSAVVSLKRDSCEADWSAGVAAAIAGVDRGVIAIDVSRAYPIGDQASARSAGSHSLVALEPTARVAHDTGLQVFVHCGWMDTLSDVWTAIDILGAQRIGHGTPVGNNIQVMRRLALEGVLVEVCPTASESVGGQPLHDHPVRDWLHEGIAIALGSDHPLELKTGIGQEVARVQVLGPDVTNAVASHSRGLGAAPRTNG